MAVAAVLVVHTGRSDTDTDTRSDSSHLSSSSDVSDHLAARETHDSSPPIPAPYRSPPRHCCCCKRGGGESGRCAEASKPHS